MIFNDVCPGARRRRSRGASSSSLSDAKVIISWLNRLLQIAEGRGRQAAAWCGPLWSLKIWAEFPLKSPRGWTSEGLDWRQTGSTAFPTSACTSSLRRTEMVEFQAYHSQFPQSFFLNWYDVKIWVNCESSKKNYFFFSVSTTLRFISVWTPICPHSTVNNPKRLLELKHRHAASNPLAASLESPIGVSWLAYQLISVGNGRCCFLLSWPVAGTQKYWFESLSFWPLVSAAQFVGWLFVNRVLGCFFFNLFYIFHLYQQEKVGSL